MREKTKKLSSILLCLVFCFSFSTAVYAASYIYYDGGLKSATVDVENRLSNSSVYKNSVSAWNSTNTPVNIKTVPGSGHSYVIDGVYKILGMVYILPKIVNGLFQDVLVSLLLN